MHTSAQKGPAWRTIHGRETQAEEQQTLHRRGNPNSQEPVERCLTPCPPGNTKPMRRCHAPTSEKTECAGRCAPPPPLQAADFTPNMVPPENEHRPCPQAGQMQDMPNRNAHTCSAAQESSERHDPKWPKPGLSSAHPRQMENKVIRSHNETLSSSNKGRSTPACNTDKPPTHADGVPKRTRTV